MASWANAKATRSDLGRSARVGVLFLLLAFLLPAPGSDPRAERPRVYAITGATVVVSPGQVLEAGRIVLRDGLIEAVGAEIAIPPDAVEIDGKGLWVYPGLIDALSSLGLKEEGGPPQSGSEGGAPGRPQRQSPSATSTGPGPVHSVARVHPEKLARDQIQTFDDERKREMEKVRNLGFTTVNVVPRGGIFRGQSAVIHLADDRPVSEMIVRDRAAQHVAFDRGRFGEGYPTSLMGAVAAIRQALLDAERHATWLSRWQENPAGLPRPESLPAFEALAPVLSGRQPIVFDLEDPWDFAVADSLAGEFSLNAVLAASGHEWEIAPKVAAAGRWLILPVGPPDKPKVEDEGEALDVPLKEMRRYLEFFRGPAILREAGAKFVFTTRGLKNIADFPKNFKKILDAGISEDALLAAWTTLPATLLGVDRLVGTLEAGKIADVVVSDGPLFQEKTKVKRVFVDGIETRIEERKKPKGDPSAVVDPRGEWSVVLEFSGQSVSRTWTITGKPGAYAGTAETRTGTVSFERVDLEGNALTVVLPPGERGGSAEATVIITGDSFEGTVEMGPRTVPVKGTRAKGPEGGGR